MRYAVVSDIHANLQAWNAVLTDIRSVEVDRIVCLGDTVGYGPDPAPVLESVHAHVHHLVLGNHDAVVANRLDPACFNSRARAVAEWTREQLDPKAGAFLGSLPYVLQGSIFRCCHANPVSPAQFEYVLDESAARSVWDHCPEQVIFIGHSHLPGLFVMGRSRTPHWLEPTDFSLEAHKRYIVNVGSVGFPRGRDIRASYCLFDHACGDVHFRRVPFDLEAFGQAMEASSVPVKSAHVLNMAADLRPPPIRQQLDFSPPSRQAISGEKVSVVTIGELERTARRWRSGAVALFLLLLLTGGAAFRALRQPRQATREPARGLHWNRRILAPPAGECCFEPLNAVGRITHRNPLPRWSLAVEQPETQVVRVDHTVLDPDSGETDAVLQVVSREPLPFVLTSAPVSADGDMRFEIQVSCKGDVETGHIEVCVVQTLADGTEKTVLHYPLERITAERWKFYHKSTRREGLGEAGAVAWVLKGEFAGRVEFRSCNMKRIR
jgi:predicted phosphodiesterase